MICGFRRLEDQLKRWNDVAKLIGRAWRARQGLKATLKERSERVQHLDDEFATRELASFASRTFRVEHSDSLDRLPSASAGLLPQGSSAPEAAESREIVHVAKSKWKKLRTIKKPA